MCALTLLRLDDFSDRVTYILSMIKIFFEAGKLGISWGRGGGGASNPQIP